MGAGVWGVFRVLMGFKTCNAELGPVKSRELRWRYATPLADDIVLVHMYIPRLRVIILYEYQSSVIHLDDRVETPVNQYNRVDLVINYLFR